MRIWHPLSLAAVTYSLLMMMTSCSYVNAMGTLFDFSEPIAQFTKGNFTTHVLHSPTPWIIEFYASWCGHCQRFAPKYVELARDIRGWHNMIRVGAVACSDPVNSALCRLYNIWGYPTLKVFEANSASENKGLKYNGAKSPEAIRDTLTHYLAHFPPLQPVRTPQNVLDQAPSSAHNSFVVCVNTSIYSQQLMAYQAILDASEFHESVKVGWMNQSDCESHGVKEIPSFHEILQDGSLKIVALETVNRTSIGDYIRSYTQTPNLTPETTTQKVLTENNTSQLPPGVYMQDLESGLYYSLWVEVAAQQNLDRSKQKVLLKHLILLYQNIPYSENIRLFLKRIITALKAQKGEISGTEWIQILKNAQDSDAYVPSEQRWAGCMGTLSKFRGYPCSVWTTYHTLTVAAYLKESTDPEFDPQEVLLTMREYVANFLGCRHCANHFAKMAAGIESQVNGSTGGMLWLWRSHNKVNIRLHGDPTEDPQHPKIQFPSDEECPGCRLNGTSVETFDNDTAWNVSEVVNYLTRYYDPGNIINVTDSAENGTNSKNVSSTGGPDETGGIKMVVHNMKWVENVDTTSDDEIASEEDDETHGDRNHRGGHAHAHGDTNSKKKGA